MAPKAVIKIESDSSMDISSDSSSDSFSDIPSEDTWESTVMTIQGPNIVGDETYDRFWVSQSSCHVVLLLGSLRILGLPICYGELPGWVESKVMMGHHRQIFLKPKFQYKVWKKLKAKKLLHAFFKKILSVLTMKTTYRTM